MSPNQEITTYLKKFEQEQSHIENRRYEMRREIDELEHEDANLVDRFNKLESITDECQCALVGEPILIWVELQRFGF